MKKILLMLAFAVSVGTQAQVVTTTANSESQIETVNSEPSKIEVDNSIRFVGGTVIMNTSFVGNPQVEFSVMELEPGKLFTGNDFGISSDFQNYASLRYNPLTFNLPFVNTDKFGMSFMPSLGIRYTLSFKAKDISDYLNINLCVTPRISFCISKKVMLSVGYQGELYFTDGFFMAHGVTFGVGIGI